MTQSRFVCIIQQRGEIIKLKQSEIETFDLDKFIVEFEYSEQDVEEYDADQIETLTEGVVND